MKRVSECGFFYLEAEGGWFPFESALLFFVCVCMFGFGFKMMFFWLFCVCCVKSRIHLVVLGLNWCDFLYFGGLVYLH